MNETQALAVVEAKDAMLELQEPSGTAASGYHIVVAPVPATLEFTPLQAAIILKTQSGFQDASLAYLIYVLAFCYRAGLDPLRDIYRVGGRIAVYDEVKIRNMRSQPTLEWVTVSDPERSENPISGNPDVYVVAEAKDSRWEQPEKYTAWLSEWASKSGASQVWTQSPIDALQRKALARLAHRMYPMFGEQEPSTALPDQGGKLADAFKAEAVTVEATEALNNKGRQ